MRHTLIPETVLIATSFPVDYFFYHSLNVSSQFCTLLTYLYFVERSLVASALMKIFPVAGLNLWNQTRQRWVGPKKPETRTQQLREPKLR